jgi:tripartite-type tricarboxylate transporter receptor subunit TctC
MMLLRTLAALLFAAALAPFAAGDAAAQKYPSRTITLVVPYPAGGLSDRAVRVVALELQKRLGQSVVVENRPGGSGTIGASQVLRAAPDGYTLLVNATGDVIRLHYISVPYDILNDFAQIGMIAEGPPMVLVVKPNAPFKTPQELAAYARQHPGKMNFGSSGPGTGPATAIVQLNVLAKTNIVDVPYRGVSQAAMSVVSGDIDGAFVYLGNAKPLADGGKVRALAVTSAKRSPAWPNLPTMIEAGFPGFDLNGFVGLAAPAKTPPDIITLLNRELNAVVNEKSFRDQFAKDGMEPRAKNSPAEFAAYMKEEIEKNRVLAETLKKKPQ